MHKHCAGEYRQSGGWLFLWSDISLSQEDDRTTLWASHWLPRDCYSRRPLPKTFSNMLYNLRYEVSRRTMARFAATCRGFDPPTSQNPSSDGALSIQDPDVKLQEQTNHLLGVWAAAWNPGTSPWQKRSWCMVESPCSNDVPSRAAPDMNST